MSLPIRTYGKYIHAKSLNIVYFLSDIVFYYNFIGISGLPYGFNTFQNIGTHIKLSALPVKAIACHTDYQVIA